MAYCHGSGTLQSHGGVEYPQVEVIAGVAHTGTLCGAATQIDGPDELASHGSGDGM